MHANPPPLGARPRVLQGRRSARPARLVGPSCTSSSASTARGGGACRKENAPKASRRRGPFSPAWRRKRGSRRSRAASSARPTCRCWRSMPTFSGCSDSPRNSPPPRSAPAFFRSTPSCRSRRGASTSPPPATTRRSSSTRTDSRWTPPTSRSSSGPSIGAWAPTPSPGSIRSCRAGSSASSASTR